MYLQLFSKGSEVYYDIGFKDLMKKNTTLTTLLYGLVTGETCLVVHMFKFLQKDSKIPIILLVIIIPLQMNMLTNAILFPLLA